MVRLNCFFAAYQKRNRFVLKNALAAVGNILRPRLPFYLRWERLLPFNEMTRRIRFDLG